MKMRLIIISLTTVAMLVGCRKSINASYGSNDENKDELYNQEVTTIQNVAEESSSICENLSSDYDDFKLYNTYSPDKAIMDTSLSEGALVQIGTHVLQLGKATIRDFVDAGVDLYNTKSKMGDWYGHPNRDKEVNEKYINEYVERYQSKGSSGRTGYLSGDVRIDLLSGGSALDVEDPSNTVIDSIMIEFYPGDTGIPDSYLYGEENYRDVSSIFINKGIKFTGSITAIPDDYGNLEINQSGENTNGHKTLTRVYTANGTYCQFLFADDHISNIVMKLK